MLRKCSLSLLITRSQLYLAKRLPTEQTGEDKHHERISSETTEPYVPCHARGASDGAPWSAAMPSDAVHLQLLVIMWCTPRRCWGLAVGDSVPKHLPAQSSMPFIIRHLFSSTQLRPRTCQYCICVRRSHGGICATGGPLLIAPTYMLPLVTLAGLKTAASVPM